MVVRRVINIQWFVVQHLSHILVRDVSIHLLEADRVGFRKVCPVMVIECLNNLGQLFLLVLGIRLGIEFVDCLQRHGIANAERDAARLLFHDFKCLQKEHIQ